MTLSTLEKLKCLKNALQKMDQIIALNTKKGGKRDTIWIIPSNESTTCARVNLLINQEQNMNQE